jgi:transcriptional regulator with XRE-family HTH domain
MDQPSLEVGSGANILSQAMREIRKRRGLSLIEVAQAMQMSRRTYEEFEGGRGRITHERIMAFANATNADPFALILAVDFRSAQFAIDCADTKLAYILISHLRDFWEAEAGDIPYLEPTNIIGAAERLFGDLADKLSDSDTFLRNWMDKRTGWIGLTALGLRGIKRRRRKE